MSSILNAPRFMLPKDEDMEAWATVACDQFTAESEYWNELKKFVAGRRSTLELVLPEIYLSQDNRAAEERITAAMKRYIEDGVFKTTDNGFILLERSTPYVGRRLGLMAAIDLEAYDYLPKTNAAVRATEKTIEERIPPRLAIRKNAPIELSHVMLLFEDEERKIIEELYERRDEFEKLYDFTLNMNGGRLKGWFIADYKPIIEAFDRLATNKPFLFAVGDGNHSLATAKAHWNNFKQTLTAEERKTHPARFSLVELVNIYDDGIYFEPIHRFVQEADGEFIAGLKKLHADFTFYRGGSYDSVHCGKDVPESIAAVDAYIAASGLKVEYVHGSDHLKALVDGSENSVGISFSHFDKSKLFSYVAEKGLLPRKAFSLGEGVEKRYYLEAKRIVTEF